MAWGQPLHLPLMELPRGWGSPCRRRSQTPRAEPPGIHGSFLGSAWTAGGGQRGRGVGMETPPGWAGRVAAAPRAGGTVGLWGGFRWGGCPPGMSAPAPSSRRSPEGGSWRQDCSACASGLWRRPPSPRKWRSVRGCREGAGAGFVPTSGPLLQHPVAQAEQRAWFLGLPEPSVAMV